MKHRARIKFSNAAAGPRLALLLLVGTAFLLASVSQAAANPTLKVNLFGLGGGGGTVKGKGGLPPIDCHLAVGLPPGSPPEGDCESEMEAVEAGTYAASLEATAGPPSEFLFWEVVAGFAALGCTGAESSCTVLTAESVNAEVNVYFACADCHSDPPLLTVTKTGSGEGWIHSSPAGINCGLSCTAKVSSFEGGAEVALTAYGLDFVEWEVCPGTVSANQCTVTMDEAKEAIARFDAPPTPLLTVIKVGPGEGWVHSSPPGINCGLSCTAKASFIEATEVTLTAYGLEFSEWVNCPGTVSFNQCTIHLSGHTVVEVEFG